MYVRIAGQREKFYIKDYSTLLGLVALSMLCFNVGDYRREQGLTSVGNEFFKKDNKSASAQREELAMKVQEKLYKWLEEQTEDAVAIFDATNTTIARRKKLIEQANKHSAELLFIESICDDKDLLEQNILSKLKNKDYVNMEP
eukprot:UN31472